MFIGPKQHFVLFYDANICGTIFKGCTGIQWFAYCTYFTSYIALLSKQMCLMGCGEVDNSIKYLGMGAMEPCTNSHSYLVGRSSGCAVWMKQHKCMAVASRAVDECTGTFNNSQLLSVEVNLVHYMCELCERIKANWVGWLVYNR